MKLAGQFRVGLQLKSVLVLTFVVIGVTASGGGLYFITTSALLRNNDRQRAVRLGEALALAARSELQEGRPDRLQRLAGDFIDREGVCYVSLLDGQGRVVSSADSGARAYYCNMLARLPIALCSTMQLSDDVLALACPVVVGGPEDEGDTVVGAVRLILDTSATTTHLVRVQHQMGMIAATIVLCGIPVGYLLVWRVMLQPVRRLVGAARRLAGGDFSARAGLRRNDEIGEMAQTFDAMADQVARMRDELLFANERLERKVLERTEELAQSNRRLKEEMAEKEDFLRAVSHDLNAPLRNIAGMATMAMVKWRDQLPEDVVARLNRIQANVDLETSLIAELLELSRIRSRPQKRAVIDLKELLEGLAPTFEFDLRARNIALTIQGPMPSLYVEKNRIRQVFQNLIDNAIKYMDRRVGGRIEVGYQFVDGFHQFHVRDNGPGIPPDEHEKIFHIFRRAETAAAAKVDGKGVGLTVVKTIVANYEGSAWVQSNVGEGAAFYFTLGQECTRPPRQEPTDEDAADRAAVSVDGGLTGG